jgi:hypothetical protein
MAQRAAEDPEQVKVALRSSARRLLALVALKERAPRVFAAKVAELRAQGETMRAAAELRRLEADPGAAKDAVDAARATLEANAAKQVETMVAARGEELSALEQHIERMRKDLARDGANVGELAKEVARRARVERRPRGGDDRDGPGRPDGPDGPEGPDRPDRPDRRDRPDRPDAPPPPRGEPGSERP